jgi:O-antigen/teichoic acid export membrane protein
VTARPRVALRAEGSGRRLVPGSALSTARDFLREATPLFLSLSLLNASNYVFHVAVSRMLGPSQYGALAALLAFLLVVSVPCGVLQTAVAKRVALLRAAGHGDEVGPTAIGVCKGVAGLAGVCSVAMVLASPLFAAFLHVGIGSSVLLGPYVFLALVTSVPVGVLQGELRFGGVGGVSAVGVAVRLASGLWLVHVGMGVPGALLASILAQMASLVLATWMLRAARSQWRTVPARLEGMRQELTLTLAALGSFWLLAEADILLARHYLGHEASGLYAVASLLARAILFLPGAVSLVALPHFAEVRERPAEARRWLAVSLGVTAALVAVGLFVLVLLRQPIMRLMFGHRYEGAAAVLPVLGLAMACLALVNVIVFFHVAIDSRAHRLLLGGVTLEVFLVAVWHKSPGEIAAVVVCVSGAMAALQWHAALAMCRQHQGMDWPLGDGQGRPSSLSAAPTLDVSVVLPCHNAGSGLRSILASLSGLTDEYSCEIIVVSDGSTDDTVRVAREFPPDLVRVLEYPRRSGKGHALRVGLAETRGRYVAFMDADGDIAPDAIRPFLVLMELYEPDIVLGSKRHPLSEVEYPPLRRAMSWGYHKLTRLLFRVKVRDTQTGMKLIRRDVLAAVLPRMLEKRYAFDLELLVVARVMGFTRVFEAPIKLDYRFASHVDPQAVVRIGLDTAAVFFRRYILDFYTQAGRTADADALGQPPVAAGAPATVWPAS